MRWWQGRRQADRIGTLPAYLGLLLVLWHNTADTTGMDKQQATRHAGGRPRKMLSGEALSATVRLRILPATLATLRHKAGARGQCLSDYLRGELARIARL